jgi:hypothetical protein
MPDDEHLAIYKGLLRTLDALHKYKKVSIEKIYTNNCVKFELLDPDDEDVDFIREVVNHHNTVTAESWPWRSSRKW